MATMGEPGCMENPKYRLVFDETYKEYRIQKRFLYFWYITLYDKFGEHELYMARYHLNWLRQAESIRKTIRKIKEKYIILDD